MGELRWDFTGFDLDRVKRQIADRQEAALAAGVEHMRQVAVERTPIETGHLRASAHTEVHGDTASLVYPGPYARYQEFRLDLHHETGQALYLTSTVVEERDRTVEIVARALFGGAE